MNRIASFRAAVTVLLAVLALVQPAAARVEKLTVHSAAVEGNLEGNSPDRTVYVILPESYDRSKARRYPVLYFLHGFNSTAERYMGFVPFDSALQAAKQDLIVVVPDSMTKWGGSMYSNSPTTGNFEDFIARDLVGWTDTHFRTIARSEARGLAGHSMGGYGTLKLGMKHPDLFGALYAMNPCCLTPRPAGPADARFESWTVEQALAADWITRGNFAVASAWSPNPGKPPFFADLATRASKVDDFVLAQWAANAPAAMAGQYLPALRSMKRIAIETGDADFVKPDDIAMHEQLLKLGVAHDWEVYQGDHGNRVAERFAARVLPFFATNLKGADR